MWREEVGEGRGGTGGRGMARKRRKRRQGRRIRPREIEKKEVDGEVWRKESKDDKRDSPRCPKCRAVTAEGRLVTA